MHSKLHLEEIYIPYLEGCGGPNRQQPRKKEGAPLLGHDPTPVCRHTHGKLLSGHERHICRQTHTLTAPAQDKASLHSLDIM